MVLAYIVLPIFNNEILNNLVDILLNSHYNDQEVDGIFTPCENHRDFSSKTLPDIRTITK